MNDIVRSAVRLAYKNKTKVERSKNCGCFYCGHMFPGSTVTEYTDSGQTALCPHCKVDTVLAGDAGLVVCEDILKKVNDFWLKK